MLFGSSLALYNGLKQLNKDVDVIIHLISTIVPLSKVVSSFVGRGGSWIHSDEYEVLVESSLLRCKLIARKVFYFGDSSCKC